VRALLSDINVGASALPATVELIVFPPAIFLSLSEQLVGEGASRIKLGGQNVSAESSGAFTGEISTNMLAEFHCRYVLVGHSERRTLYGETDEIVRSKYIAVSKTPQLTPVLCLGETQAEREQGETEAVLHRQLDAVLANDPELALFDNTVLAYEPVWAIGTGLTATAEQAQSVHARLRAHIARYDADVAKRTRILYGGSVKPENAVDLFSMPDVDGGLIGGASLNAEQFLAIARSLT